MNETARQKILDLLEELFLEGAYLPGEDEDEAIVARIMECYGGEVEALAAERDALRAALARAERERDEARADRERMRADAEELQAAVRALTELLLRADSHVSWCLHRHEQKTHFGRDTADVLQRWLADVAPITRPIAAPTAADPDKEG